MSKDTAITVDAPPGVSATHDGLLYIYDDMSGRSRCWRCGRFLWRGSSGYFREHDCTNNGWGFDPKRRHDHLGESDTCRGERIFAQRLQEGCSLLRRGGDTDDDTGDSDVTIPPEI